MESKEHVFMNVSRKSLARATVEELWAENAQLRQKLLEVEETIQAIREGSIESFVVGQGPTRRVYSQESVDRPFRFFVEGMQQGAATLYADGCVAYCNQRMADLLKRPVSKLIGTNFEDLVSKP